MSRSRRRSDGSLWGERTIRNGQTRFFGKRYRVDPIKRDPKLLELGDQWRSEPDYDGRLDGKRGLFYNYGNYPSLADSIFLHSCPPDPEVWPGLNCIDGYFVRQRWREIAP